MAGALIFGNEYSDTPIARTISGPTCHLPPGNDPRIVYERRVTFPEQEIR